MFHAYLFPKPSPETPELSDNLRNLFVEALLGLSFNGRWGTRARARYAVGIKKVHVGGIGQVVVTPKLGNLRQHRLGSPIHMDRNDRTPNYTSRTTTSKPF